MTNFTQQNAWSEQELAYTAAIFNDLQSQELEMGVDTDAELQSLLILENIYAANARLVQAVDEMMQELLRL